MTKTLVLYKYDELTSDKAKEKAREWAKNALLSQEHFWAAEYRESLDAFCKLFDVKWTGWGDNGVDYVIKACHFATELEHMKGLRLLKYIWNNYGDDLFKPKYISNGKRHRYSKCQREASCVFTGFCADMDILDPIYTFMLHKPDASTTFADLIRDCLHEWNKSRQSDYENQMTDEYAADHLTENEYYFTEGGKHIV